MQHINAKCNEGLISVKWANGLKYFLPFHSEKKSPATDTAVSAISLFGCICSVCADTMHMNQ